MSESNLPRERVNPGLAAVLSLILPGGGHLYMEDIFPGISYLVGGILGYIAFIIPGVIIAFVSAAHSYKSAKRKNYKSDKKNSKNKRGAIDGEVESDQFIDRMEKLKELYDSDILSNEEYNKRKEKVIYSLKEHGIQEDPEDFLFYIRNLKGEILEEGEIKSIKRKIL